MAKCSLQMTKEFLLLKFILKQSVLLNRFRQRFQHRQPPTKRSIKKVVQKYQDRATVENRNAGRSDRLKTTRSGANIDRVKAAVELIQLTGFKIQPSGSKHVITRKFSRDFIPLIIIL